MTKRLWFWCVFPAVAMSLGWMLRGYIGGGSLGAMIPGAMIGLALCLLLGREKDAGIIATFAAVGVGFGGQETYGQTVGLSMKPDTYIWALTGFFLKGGIWGLLGGAAIGIALTRDRYANKDLITSFGLMIAGTYTGWQLINAPKLIYFSDRIDRPREELWAGLLLGTLLMLFWLSWRAGARLPWSFALWGALGGSIGFSSGAAAQVWGRAHMPDMPLGWWKFMEMTFGALLGLGFGYCAWRNRNGIERTYGVPSAAPLPQALGWALVVIVTLQMVMPKIPGRFDYTIIGALLLTVALFSEPFRWQTAIAATYCAFAIDLLKYRPTYSPAVMWALVAATTLAVVVYTARHPHVKAMFVLMTWTSVGMALLKSFLPPQRPAPHSVMESLFVVLAVLCTIWARSVFWQRPEATASVVTRRKVAEVAEGKAV